MFPIQIQSAEQRLKLISPMRHLGEFQNWTARWNSIDQMNRKTLQQAALPEAYHRKIRNGSVEAVSFSVDSIVANGWRWQPRPVFQTYCAYTPKLDLLNAAHVNSKRAADYSLLYWLAIDSHHLFFEDPASWRETLNWYDLALTEADRALLKRRDSPRYKDLVPFGTTSAKWNEPTRLPVTSDVLVMHAEIHRSLIGSARRFLYRGTPVVVRATYRSGAIRRYRAIPENLENGAIVNPLPESIAALPDLFRRESGMADPVLSIQLEAPNPGDFQATIPIRGSRLPLRTDEDLRIESSDQVRLSSLTPLWKPGQPAPVTGANATTGRSTLTVQPTTIDPQLLFAVGPSLPHYKTIVVRARFERSDYVDVFFGKQVEGRGIRGRVPKPGTWYDIFFNVNTNPFWVDEAGMMLRFDTASELGVGRKIEVAGLMGKRVRASRGKPAC